MVVLFDVDGTLGGANCTAALVRGLAADGIVPRASVLSLGLQQVLYRLGCRAFPDLMAAAYGLLEQREIVRIEACAERVVREDVAPALYPDALARIDRHRARGDRIVLASAAPAVMIECVRRRVGVGEAIATQFARHGSRFGAVAKLQAYGVGKVELARSAGLFQHGPPHVYTDHAEDWPLVRAAGFATLVNPTARFAREVGCLGIAHEVVRWARG